MAPDVTDLRSDERYVPLQPLTANFGPAQAAILNLAEHGAQIEHAQPLRLASRGRLVLRVLGTSFTAPGIVIWSRLSQTASAEG